jgi:DNA-binding NarL/FixJ family response regulator
MQRETDDFMSLIKTVLVDDNAEFLEVAADFLAGHAPVSVIGKAASGFEALEMAVRHQPSLVLVDMSMPVMNGFDVTRKLKLLPSPPRVILVSLYDGAEWGSLAVAAGADGFVTKSDFVDHTPALIAKLFGPMEMEVAHGRP